MDRIFVEDWPMTANIHRFEVGSFSCAVVNDGTFAYPHPAQILFDNVPDDHLAPALQMHEIDLEGWAEYISPYPTLLVNTGDHLVLIDTGAGDFAPTTGRLMPNLRSLGVAPEQIDTVILTHGHLDHIGGTLNAEGEPAFPNARYVMSSEEWAFWESDPDLSFLKIPPSLMEAIHGTARAKLPPIADRIALVADGDEIVPGIQAIAAPGHTPGHLALTIRCRGEQLLCCVDAVLHPVHVEQPDWVSVVDHSPHETVVTRRELLGQAAASDVLAYVTHFRFPCLGHVVQQEVGWRWRPLAPTHSDNPFRMNKNVEPTSGR